MEVSQEDINMCIDLINALDVQKDKYYVSHKELSESDDALEKEGILSELIYQINNWSLEVHDSDYLT